MGSLVCEYDHFQFHTVKCSFQSAAAAAAASCEADKLLKVAPETFEHSMFDVACIPGFTEAPVRNTWYSISQV